MIFIGMQGSGKGTQIAKLQEAFVGVNDVYAKLPQIATGNIFRDEVKRKTELGNLLNGYMKQGLLVPDNVTFDIIKQRLAQPNYANGVVFDGFPRTVKQAMYLDSIITIHLVVVLDVPLDEALERINNRLTCDTCQTVYANDGSSTDCKMTNCNGKLFQRLDDTPEALTKRINTFSEHTVPVIDYYSKQGKAVIINTAGGSIDENHKKVKEAVFEFLKNNKHMQG